MKQAIALVVFVAGLCVGASAQVTYFSRASGNWTDNNTWSLTVGGAAVGAGVFPVAADVANIFGGFTVTVDVNSACTTVQLGATPAMAPPGNFGILTFSGAFTLAVSGNIQVGGNGNTARRGEITFVNGAIIQAGSITLGNATAPAGGTAAFPNRITMTAGGHLSVNGSIVVNTVAGPGNVWTPGTGRVELTATNTLPSTIFTSFNNLRINGGTTSLGIGVAVGGAIDIISGSYNANGLTTTATGLATLSGGSYLASTATQTFNGGLTISGGTFTGSTGAVTTTDVTLSSGTLTAPSGTFSVSGNWVRSGGTFTPGANTVTFTNTVLRTLNSGGSAFNNISHTGAGTLQLLTNGLTTGGAFTNSAGSFDANGQTHTVTGLSTVSGGSYLASTATQTFNGGLTISGGTFTGSTGAVTTTDVTLSSGTLTAPSGTFSVSGNWVRSGGTFTPGANTVTFTNTVLRTLNSGGSAFNNISHTGAGTLQLVTNGLTTGGAFTNSAGSFDANGETHTVTGLSTVSGGSYLASTATQTFNGGLTISGGTFTGSTGAVTTTDVTLSSGTLTAPSGTFSVSGNWVQSGGTFTPGANTVTFTNTVLRTLNSGGSAFNNISHTGAGTLQLVTNGLTTGGAFTNSAGSFDANGQTHTVTGLSTVSGGSYLASTATQTFNGGLTISGGTFTGSTGAVTTTDVTLSSGTLTAPSGTFSVSGNWVRSGGTFTPGANTVTFTNTVLRTLNSGGSAFNNISHTGAGTLQLVTNGLTTGGTFTNSAGSFDANGQTHTVTGLSTVSGGSYLASTATQTFNGGLTISGGTFTGLTGAVSTAGMTLTSGTLTAPTGLFTVSGNWTRNGGTFSPGSGAVTFNGVTQTIGGPVSTTFNDVNTSGGTNTTTGIATTIGGNLAIRNGTTFTVGGFDLSVGGTTTVGGGASGSLVISSSVGTKTFAGLVTVPSGATWNNSGNSAVNLQGGLTNNGTFTAGSGIYTFDTNTQSLNGTMTIPNLLVTGITLINNNSVTVTTDLSGSGDFTQASGSSLTLSGTSAISTLNAINSNNTVTYDGASQSINPTSYHHLTIDQSSGDASIIGPTVVYGNLNLTTGNVDLSANLLTLGPAASIPAPTGIILASSGGEVRKEFTGTGSFTFPIGDDTGAVESSPISINVTSAGGFSSAYIGVSVADANHPNNASIPNFLSRYWNVMQSGITACVADISATYIGTDVNGTVAATSAAQLSGVFNQTSNPWIKFAPLAGVTLTASGATLTAGQTSVFTGITRATPTVTNNGGNISICNSATVPMSTTFVGDATPLYLWSSVPVLGGLSSTTIANPTATPTVSTDYTVTVTDGNGIVSAPSNIRTVNVNSALSVVAATVDNLICEDETTGLTATPSGGTPGYTYLWSSVPASNVSGSTSATPTFIPTVTGAQVNYVFTVTVTDNFAVVCTTQGNVSVTVDPIPTVLAVTQAATNICNGTSTNVQIALSQAGVNYQLRNNVGNIAIGAPVAGTGALINLPTGALSSTTTFNVLAINSTTLCDTPMGNTVTVTVNPAISVVATTTDNLICEDETTGLTATPSGGTPGYTYLWSSVPASNVSGSTSATPTFIPTVTGAQVNYVFTVTVTDNFAVVCTSQGNVSVTVDPIPTVLAVTQAATNICNGASTSVQIAGSQAGVNYQLRNNVGNIAIGAPVAGTGALINLPTGALSSTTTFNVLAINATTLCDTPMGNTVTVTVNSAISVVATTTDNLICEDETTALTATPSGGTPGYTFLWSSVPASNVSGSTSATPTFIPTVTGAQVNYVFTVTVTDNFAVVCTSQGNVSVTVDPIPTVLAVTQAATNICNGTSTNVQIALSQAGVNYQLRNNVGNIAIGAPVAGTGALINLPTGALSSTTTFNVLAINATTLCDTPMGNTVTVTVNPAISVVATTTDNLICEDETTGLTATPSGGTPGYTFLWSSVPASNVSGSTSATPTFIPTVTGAQVNYVFTVTVTDNFAVVCTSQGNVSVTVDPIPTVLAVTQAATNICNGASTSVQIAGSQAGVNYQLRNNVGNIAIGAPVAGTGALINLPTGALSSTTTFNVLAINSTTLCDTPMGNTVTVTVNSAISVVATTTDNLICEDETTALTATPSGGTPGYTYLWSSVPASNVSGSTSATPTFIPTVTGAQVNYVFTVTVTDNFAVVCTSQGNVSVTVDPIPTVLAVTQAATNICNGASTSVQIAGSQAGVNYQLRNNVGNIAIGAPVAGTGALINLPTGALTATTTFNVLAINATTLCDTPMGNTVTVTVNSAISVVATTTDNLICEDETTALTATPSGGTPGYTYLWSSVPASNVSGSTSATPTFIPTVTGAQVNYVFTVTVTDNFAVVCTTQGNVSVTVDPIPTVLAVTQAATNICNGTSTNVQIALSQAGVNYQLRNNVGNIAIGAPVAGTGALINLPTGALTATTTFNVLAINATTLCDTPMGNTVTVTVNSAISVVATTTDNLICEDETTPLTATPSGGTPGYTYLWSSVPASNVSGSTSATPTFIPTVTGAQVNYVFTVTVTDNFAVVCTSQGNVSVTVDPIPTVLAVTQAATNICNGTSTNVQIALSQAGVNYQLRNNVGNIAIGAPVAGTGALINLPTGALSSTTTFNVLAINSTTLCDTPMGNTVTVTVNSAISVVATTTDNLICEDETTALTATPSGGTPGYTYLWSSVPASNVSGSTSATPTFIPTVTGAQVNYVFTVTVTDNFAVVCTSQGNVSVTVDPIPTVLAVTQAATNICNGASTSVQIALSQAGVNYQLRNNVGNIAIGAPVAGTGALINLPTGALSSTTTFNVLAINATTLCDTPMGNTVTVTVNPAISVVATTTDNLICEDETTGLTATPSGGTPGYTYLWSSVPASNVSGSTSATPTFIPTVTGAQVNYVFTVTVTDNFAVVCTSQGNVSVTVDPIPTVLAVTQAATNICNGASTSVQIAGSQAGVNYQLRNNVGNIAIGAPVAGTGALINLPTGNLTATTTFNVLAINATTLCDTPMGNTVTVTVNPVMSVIAATVDNLICEDETTGLTATPSGGTPGYTFLWSSVPASNVSGSTSATPTFIPTVTGAQVNYVFTVTVTDNFAVVCTSQGNVSVTVDPIPTVLAVTQAATNICNGTSTNVQIALSQAGVNYQLRNNVGNIAIGAPVAGTGALINLPTGSLTATTTFNVLAINSTTLCDTPMGNTVTVTVNSAISVVATTTDNLICEDETTALTATPSGGTPGYTYLWSSVPASNVSGSTSATPTFIPTVTGAQVNYVFTVTVTDNFAVVCTTQGNVSVTVDPIPTVLAVTQAATNICNGTSTNVQIALSQAGVNYQLRNNVGNIAIGAPVAGTGALINLPTGALSSTTTFNVLAINATTLCDTQMGNTVTVTVNPAISVVATTTDNLICEDETTGLTATPSGGTPGYTYLWSSVPASNVSGSTSATPTFIPTVTGAQVNYVFTVTVTDNFAVVCTTQGNVSVTVDPIPTVLAVTQAATNICNGTSTNVQIALSQAGVNYQLRNNVGNIAIGAPVAGTGALINLPTGALSSTTTFNVLAINATTLCDTQMGNTVTVTVNSAISVVATTTDNLICEDETTALTATPSGGTPGYTYLWSSVPASNVSGSTSATPTFIPTVTGAQVNYVFTVTVTDNFAVVCTSQGNVSVTVDPIPTVLAVTQAATNICNGTSTNVQIALSQAGVNYQLRNNVGNIAIGAPVAGTGALINLPTGALSSTTTFNVLAINATTLCDTQMGNTVTVTVNSAISVVATTTDNLICEDETTALTATPSGGTPGYTYLWSSVPASNVSGSTSATPTFIPTVTGAQVNYVFTVTVTDNFAVVCTSQGNVSVTVDPIPTVLAVTQAATNICNGTSTNVQIALSQAGVNYQLRNNVGNIAIGAPVAGTGALINLPTGALSSTTTFNVLAINATTLCDTPMGNTVTVTVNSAISVVATTTDNLICEDETTALTATPSGGTPGYTYLWSSVPASNVSGSTSATPTFIPTVTGAQVNYVFTVTVTDNFAVVCTSQGNVSVTVDPIPTVLAVTQAATNICNGASTSVQIAGSQAGVNYQLRNNVGNIAIGAPVAGTGALINLPTGALSSTTTFNVLAINSTTLCDTPMGNTVTVTVNSAISVVATTTDNLICEDETTPLTATPSGGTPGYTFLWSSVPASNVSGSTSATPTFIPTVTGAQVNYVFTVTVTDNFAVVCTSQGNVSVTVDPIPTVLAVTQAATNICNGASTSVQIAGSQAGVNYQLRNNVGNIAIGAPVAGTGALINLPTGALSSTTTFNVLAINATTLCDTPMGNTVTVTVNSAISVVATTTDNLICEDETTGLTATPSGGTPGYTYLWSSVPASNVSGSTSATPTFIPTVTGAQVNYVFTVTVTDNFAVVCTSQGNVSVTVDPIPTVLAVTQAATNICNGASTSVQIAGSQAGVNYQLRNNVGNIAIGAPVAGTGALINLPTGALSSTTTFNVLAINATTLCDTPMGNTVTVTVNSAISVVATTTDNLICEDETTALTATPSGGTPGYTYLWSSVPASNVSGSTSATPTFIPTVTGAQVNYVFTVTVTDNFAVVCTSQGNVSVTVDPIPTVLAVTQAATNICNGTSTNVQIALSQAGVNYQLRNNVGNIAIGAPVAGTGALINLPTGALSSTTTFNVLAINSTTLCDTPMGNTVTVTVNSAISVVATTTDNLICEDETTGLTATPSGGTPGYTYLWSSVPASNVSGSTSATPTFIPTVTGAQVNYVFTVTVTDNFAVVCTSQGNVSVTVDPIPTVLAVTQAATNICNGTSTNVQIAGSQAGVNYQLRNNVGNIAIGAPVAGTGALINLPTGALSSTTTFNVLAINATTLCDTPMGNTVTVTVNSAISVVATTTDNLICEDETTALTATPSGGTPGYTYLWSSVPASNVSGSTSATPTFIPTVTGAQVNYVFTVTVTDNFAVVCTSQGNVSVTVDPIPTVLAVTQAATNICNGTSTNVQIALSQAGVNYQLRNNVGNIAIGAPVAGTGALINLPTGALSSTTTFNVLAINATTLCDTPMGNTVTVTVNSAISVVATTTDNLICEDETTPLTATPSGGTPGYTYLWSSVPASNVSGSTSATPTFIPTVTGAQVNYVFTVTVTDNFAVVCTSQGNVSVTVDPIPTVLAVTQAATNICNGASTSVQIAGSQAGVNYQLRNNVGNIAIGAPVAGTGALINLPTGALSSTTTFNVLAINATTLCDTPMGNTVTVTVNPVMSVIAATVDNLICEDETTGLTATPSGGTPGYTFLWSSVPASNVSGSTSATPTFIPTVTGAQVNYVFTVTVTDNFAVVCTSQSNVSVTVDPIPTNSLVIAPASAAICSGASTTIDITASQLGINYQLRNNVGNIAIGAPVAGGGSISLPTGILTATTTFNVLATNATTGCDTQMLTTPTVTVNQLPVLSPSLDAGVCSDLPSGITLDDDGGPVSAVTFNITAINMNGLTASAGLPVTGTGFSDTEIIDDAYTNAGLNPVNVIYTIRPVSAFGCLGVATNVILTVHPEPVGVVNTATVCSDAVFGAGLTLTTTGTSVSAASYTVNSITFSAGILTASAGLPVTGSGKSANELINDAWTNATGSNVDVIYNISPVSSLGCVGVPFTVTVTIEPEPASGPVLAGTVCSDVATGYNLAVAATYNITTASGGLIQSGGTVSAGTGKLLGELADDIWTNINSAFASIDVVYTVVPVSAAGCAGNAFTVTVPIKPEPRGANDTRIVCSNTGALGYDLQVNNITALGNTLASGFQWQAAANGFVTGETTALQVTGVINDNLVNITSLDQVVVYTVTPTGTVSLCVGDNFTVSVTVHPEPVGVVNTATVCSDAVFGAGLTLTTTGTSVSAASYTVNSITFSAGILTASAGLPVTGSGKSANELINDAWTNATGSNVDVIYNISPVSSLGCVGVPFTVTVTIEPEPASGPVLAGTVCSDVATGYNLAVAGAATYNITTASGGLIQSGGTVSAGTGKLLGELADDIWTNINSAFASIDVVYTVVPVSAAGCAGNAFTVTVPIKPEPRGANDTRIVCSNTGALGYDLQVNNITALGNTLASGFQWQAAANGFVTGETTALQVTGVINDNLVNITSLDQVVVYTVTPTGTVSLCVGDNFTVSVTVHPEPVGVVNTATVCSDAVFGAGLTLTTTGTSVSAASYTVNSITFSAGILTASAGLPVTGSGKSANELINDAWTNATGSNVDVIYNISPVSSLGCVGVPFTVTVTIEPEPASGPVLAGTVCSDVATGYNLAVAGAATYNITTASGGLIQSGGTVSAGTGKLLGELADDIWTNINSAFASIDVVYTVVPVSAAGCAGNAFTVTVPIKPEPRGANDTRIVCSNTGALGYDLQVNNITALGNALPSTFSWVVLVDNGNVSGESLAPQTTSTITDALMNVTGVDQVVVYTITPTGAVSLCTGDNITLTVTVKPGPVGMDQTVSTCSDVASNYNLINNVAILGNNLGSTFSWVAASNLNVTGESVAPVVGPIITDVLNNVTNIDQTVVYTVTPTGVNGCPGTPFMIDVLVRSEPVGVTMSAPDICSGSVVNYDLQNNVNVSGNALPATFTWVASPNANITGESTAIQTTGIISDALINTTFLTQLITYTITPTGTNGCLGNTFTINVSVFPAAQLTAGPNLEQCKDAASIALQGGITYAPNGVIWSGGLGVYSNSASPTSDYSFSDPAEVNQTLTLTLTANDPDGLGPCPIVMDQMTLKINPLPLVQFFGLPLTIPENFTPFPVLSGTAIGGLFTILPLTSNIGSTIQTPFDEVTFDPSAVTLGVNTITYTFTDPSGCTNFDSQNVLVNPVTTIDFALQYHCGPIPTPCPFIPKNGFGEFEVCSDVGMIRLVGNPAASTGLVRTDFTGVGANGAVIQAKISVTGSDWFLDTDGLPSDLYQIQYFYTNSLGDASNPLIYYIRVFASPTAIIAPPSNNCIIAAITLDGSSSFMAAVNPFAGFIPVTGYIWDFGDFNFGSGAITSHDYGPSGPGVKNVSLRVTTNQGCTDITPLSLRVGPVPAVDFNWTAICTNDLTKYHDATNPGISTIVTYTWDFGDGFILSGPAADPVPGGTHGGATIGTYKDPEHNYVTPSTYTATLTVDTNDGCTNSFNQLVFILPAGSTVTPSAVTPYYVDFESGNGNWIAEGLRVPPTTPPTFSPVSWIYGTPAGLTINSASSGSSAWYTQQPYISNGNPTYNNSESSVVNGPCFDMTQLQRPMISLDYWSDTENNLDGAVLQYSTDGGLNWFIIGPLAGLPVVDRDRGINWYDPLATIVSSPGQQLGAAYGWTNKSGGWKNARYNLDMVDPNPLLRDQVRIRVAFSSNVENAVGNTYDGFAFDNVFVGEKQRNVLVEHFTNSNISQSVTGDTWVNQRYQNQLSTRGFSDFYHIQYHVSDGGNDPLNLDNPSDPAARSLQFGVSNPPATIIDGLLDGVKFKGDYTDLDANGVEADRRALVDPFFNLKLDTIATGVNNTISVRLTITARKAINTPLIAQVALLENQTGTFRNVLRKHLFGPDGETITIAFIDSTKSIRQFDNILIDAPTTNPSQLTLVGYVQDKNTKEIYQSVVKPAPFKRGTLVVGLEDAKAATTLNGISLYPNPANGSFYMRVPETQSAMGYAWKLIDQRGVTIKTGGFDDLIDNVRQVPVNDLSNGIYFVQLSGPGQSIVHRKLVVMNRN